MSKVVTSTDLRKKTREVLEWTRKNGEAVVVETRGKPMAAILPLNEYQAYLQYKQARAASFTRLREIVAENAAYNGLTEEEALALAEHARQDFYKALNRED